MRIAFIVRDELQPVTHGYHHTGVNLLKQFALKGGVRLVHLNSAATATGPTAKWCAENGFEYVAVAVPELANVESNSGRGLLRRVATAGRKKVRDAVVQELRRVHVGERDEHIVMFMTGWDAVGDVVATLRNDTVCLVQDSITLFEQRRHLTGVRRLEGIARVAIASVREKTLLRAGFGRVVYVAERDATIARGLMPSRAASVVIMPLAVNPADFSGTLTMEERVAKYGELLLFSGTLVYLPNRDGATRLVTRILPRVRNKNARLRLVGNGGETLAALAGPSVEIAGWVPSLVEELQRATLLVAPVRMGSGAKYNVLQALAAGTPVVGTPSCFAGYDRVPPGATVCETDDEFVHAIDNLLNNPQTLAALSAAARTFALTECTWSAAADRMLGYVKDSA